MKILGITSNEMSVDVDSLYFINQVFIKNFSHIFKKYNITPVFIPSYDDFIENYCKICDGVIISGNQKHINPKYYNEELNPSIDKSMISCSRYESESKIARYFIEKDRPILGICGGAQVLNVSLGGSLFQDVNFEIDGCLDHRSKRIDEKYHQKHKIFIDNDSEISNFICKKIYTVNSSHSQAVKKLGNGCNVFARSEDGVIEGFEVCGKKFAIGVQWHPEFKSSRFDEELIEIFCRKIAFN